MAVYLIITCCINNTEGKSDFNHRKKRYLKCINHVLKMLNGKDIKIIVVENNGFRETYLNDLPCDVVFSEHNKYPIPHKGVKELADIKYVIYRYNIQPEDYVIKMTGRYDPQSSYFFDLVSSPEKQEKYDVFMKFFNVCTKEFMEKDCVLGLFASKCKHINSFKYKGKASGEVEFATHIRESVSADKIMELENLSLECCFGDNHRLLNV